MAGNQAGWAGNSGWKIVILSDNGQVRRYPWRPVVGRAVAMGLGTAILVLGVVSVLLSTALQEQQYLVNSVAAAEKRVEQLSAANAAMHRRIDAVIPPVTLSAPVQETALPISAPESTAVGGQGGNDLASDGPEWVAVDAVVRRTSSDDMLTYRLSNPVPGSERIRGRTVVVFGNDAIPTGKWRSWPSVALDQGTPRNGKAGSRFAIRYFKNVRLPIPRSSEPWTDAVVYVFDLEGRLRLTHHHSLETNIPSGKAIASMRTESNP